MDIAILVYPGMTALDAIGPYEVLNGIPDANLHFVWKTAGPVVTDIILAAAGLLKGLPATTHWAAMSALRKFGAEPMPNERVVQSGKIITAAGVSAGIDMALHLVARICGEERAKIIQLLIEYDPRPPFDSGHISKAETRIAETARSEMSRRSSNVRNLISIPALLANQWFARLKHR